MTSEKWSKKEIEESLKNMPSIRDERSPEEILNRLQADKRLQDTGGKKRNPFPWFRAVSVLAAILLIGFIGTLFVKMNDNQLDQTALHSPKEESEFGIEEAETSADEAGIMLEDRSSPVESHAIVLEEMADSNKIVPINYRAGDEVIPVSFIIPREVVETDFSESEPTTIELYEKYIEPLDLSTLGIAFYTADFATELEPTPYFTRTLSSGHVYFVANTEQNMHVEEALVKMAKPSNNAVDSVIPEHVQYDVTSHEQIAVIHFQERLDLSTLAMEEALNLIEGFMLTAAQFDKQIQFENITPIDFEEYNFSAPLPKPIGSNPIFISS